MAKKNMKSEQEEDMTERQRQRRDQKKIKKQIKKKEREKRYEHGFDTEHLSWEFVKMDGHLENSEEFAKDIEKHATRALKKFNTTEVPDGEAKYKLVKVVKVNGELVEGYIYYMTFLASKEDDDEDDHRHLTTFQAAVWEFGPPKRKVQLVRRID